MRTSAAILCALIITGGTIALSQPEEDVLMAPEGQTCVQAVQL